jgi:hypothetical protein
VPGLCGGPELTVYHQCPYATVRIGISAPMFHLHHAAIKRIMVFFPVQISRPTDTMIASNARAPVSVYAIGRAFWNGFSRTPSIYEVLCALLVRKKIHRVVFFFKRGDNVFCCH